MNARSKILTSVLSSILLGLPARLAIAQDLPVVKGKKIVASVNGEPITLDDFNREITSIRPEGEGGEPVDKKKALGALNRMINARLIVQEARRIGLDKLPEMRKMIDSFSRVTLRDELVERITRDVKANETEVERIYQEAIREWKISAVLCEKEEDAKEFEAALKAGKDFRETAKAFLGNQRAKSVEDGVYVKPSAMDSQIRQVASTMTVGSTSSIIQAKSGFVILKLEDIRSNEDPEAKEKAKQIVLTKAKREAVTAYDEGLKKKYVTIHRDVLKSIDYESPSPGFEALLKDTRVVAEIKGEKPVTVGEMTEELRYEFYHGIQRAAEKKRLNARKDAILDGLLHRKVFRKEALRLGLDKTDSYRGKVKEYETGILFGAFINKVIATGLKLNEEELKAYYASHMKEYTGSEMMRIRSLVFAKRADAESAVEKLHQGTEFQWLATHGEGQVDKDAKGVLAFDGRLILTQDLPEGVRKALAGAKAGDFRLYASPEGHFYVLVVQDVVAAKPQPYEEARQEIGRRLLGEKTRKAVEEYADKLRSLSDVKVYLKG